jgi:sulfonate transport system substrate-binding protein
MARSLAAVARGLGLAAAILFAAAGSPASAETDLSKITLRVGDQKGGNQALLAAAGELANLPYRIEWREFPAAAPLLEALNAGAIDTGYVGDAPFTFAAAAGVPMRVIGVVHQNRDGLAIVVSGKSPIQNLGDLSGKRIGTGKGSIGHYLVLALLEKAGLPADDVNLVFLSPADARAALDSGAIDAWSTWEPYTAMMEVTDGARRVVDANGLRGNQSYQVASPTAIRDKRAALEDYVRRLARARQWALGHVDAYAENWGNLMGVPKEVARFWFTRAEMRVVPIDDTVIADQQSVIDLYAKAGVIRERFDAVKAFDRSFTEAVRAAEVN